MSKFTSFPKVGDKVKVIGPVPGPGGTEYIGREVTIDRIEEGCWSEEWDSMFDITIHFEEIGYGWRVEDIAPVDRGRRGGGGGSRAAPLRQRRNQRAGTDTPGI